MGFWYEIRKPSYCTYCRLKLAYVGLKIVTSAKNGFPMLTYSVETSQPMTLPPLGSAIATFNKLYPVNTPNEKQYIIV